MLLGIDFGTSTTSAGYLDGEQIVLIRDPLQHGAAIPSSVYLTPSGPPVVGTAADNQARRDPDRYRREIKRELGRDTPLQLGDRAVAVDELITILLQHIVHEATIAQHGTAPTGAVITVPATYGEHKRRLMREAARRAGFSQVGLLEEPVAAALAYAESGGTLTEGDVVLVYDLGGGTFDAALLRQTAGGPEVIAAPAGIERCGGSDFDRAIYLDLLNSEPELQALAERPDRTGMRIRWQVAEFCRGIKHQLSAVEEVEDYLLLGGGEIVYRLSRQQLSDLIAPHLAQTWEVSRQLIAGAGLTPADITGVLLVGGSGRIPAVADGVAAALDRPVWLMGQPELAVARGAVRWTETWAAARARQRREIDRLIEAGRELRAVRTYMDMEDVDLETAFLAIETRADDASNDPPRLDPVAPVFGDDSENTREFLRQAGRSPAARSKDGQPRSSRSGSPAPEIRVGPGATADYRTIGEAIAAAPDHARILVQPGTYTETLALSKPVEIIGDDSRGTVSVTVSANGQPAVRVLNASARLANLELQAKRTRSVVVVTGSASAPTIEDCIIHGDVRHGDVRYGVMVADKATPLVRRNTIRGTGVTGIGFISGGGGIFEENHVSGCAFGVRIGADCAPVCRGNRIVANRAHAVAIAPGGRGTFEDNDLSRNKRGAWDIHPDSLPNVKRVGNIER